MTEPTRTPASVMPIPHLERHTVLPARPTKSQRTAWVKVPNECAKWRCPDLLHEASLAVLRDHLAGGVGRVTERKSIRHVGTLELVPFHQPGASARRVRPMRFIRA